LAAPPPAIRPYKNAATIFKGRLRRGGSLESGALRTRLPLEKHRTGGGIRVCTGVHSRSGFRLAVL
jgi:hypothetical protein